MHSKKSNYTFKKRGYLFVVMDGSKQYFKSTNGYYNKDELLWLDKTLEKNKNEKVIILQHFPILENSSKWLETARIEEYQEVLVLTELEGMKLKEAAKVMGKTLPQTKVLAHRARKALLLAFQNK